MKQMKNKEKVYIWGLWTLQKHENPSFVTNFVQLSITFITPVEVLLAQHVET